MRKDYTHISVLLDRTGSMETIRQDTIGGFNSFLKSQKETGGFSTMTLVQFDSQNPYEIIHDFKSLEEVPELTRKTYVPRASTPLYDAMGKAIIDLEQKLAAMPEATRPTRVMLVIVTDGQENSSKEFDKKMVQKLIKEKQQKLDWQFVFLSADLDAMEDAMATGVKFGSSMMFDKTVAGIANAWLSLALRTNEFRNEMVQNFAFNEDDRAMQDSEKNRKK